MTDERVVEEARRFLASVGDAPVRRRQTQPRRALRFAQAIVDLEAERERLANARGFYRLVVGPSSTTTLLSALPPPPTIPPTDPA